MPAQGNNEQNFQMESEPDLRLSEIIDVIKTLENQQISAPNGALTVTPSPHGAEGFTTQQQPQQSQQQQHTPQLQMLQETTANQANVSITPSTHQIPQTPPDVADLTNATSTSSTKPTPYLKIIEQPAQRAIRFRYLCEGRSAGIPGINSMPEKKTYPTIEIVGYEGEAIIVVSCVTNDAPHKPHPHNLVGKEEDGVKNGICYLTRNGKRIREVFSYLSVQCVKKMDIKKALELRESLKVDPFKTKFNHKDQPSSIDLNVVRLCFQAYIKKGNTFKQLPPVVSSPIYDKKAKSDLVISRLCSCSAKVGGGDEIIMLCEKVTKDDIKIRFFESAEDGSTVWEAFAEFQPTDVHKQFAIAFRAPRYHSTEIKQNAKVFIQLIRPSDGDHSEPLLFEYYPDIDSFKRKRTKTNGNPQYLLQTILKYEQLQKPLGNQDTSSPDWNMHAIKTEPTMSPQSFDAHRSPCQLQSPSPQPPPSPINRLSTPSPGLMKSMSASNQTQMCYMFETNTGLQDPMSPTAYQNALQQQQQFNTGNPFAFNIVSNSFTSNNNVNCDLNKFLANQPSNSTNPFIDHQAKKPSTSGGSITKIWKELQTVQSPDLQPISVQQQIQQQQFLQQQQQFVPQQQLLLKQQLQLPQQQQQLSQQQQLLPKLQQQLPQMQQQLPQLQQQLQQMQQQLPQQQQEQQPVQYLQQQQLLLQQHEQQQQQQHQFQQQQQIQHDIDIMMGAVTTEEAPTLSGLLAYVEGDPLNINSGDLPLSNIFTST